MKLLEFTEPLKEHKIIQEVEFQGYVVRLIVFLYASSLFKALIEDIQTGVTFISEEEYTSEEDALNHVLEWIEKNV